MRKFVAVAIALLSLSFGQSQTPREDGKRVALVIGNDNYSIRPLQNAVNDARAMHQALTAAGFLVIKSENAGKVAMEEAVAAFLDKIGPGDVALFYYAGHAIQIENENVLVPTDFTEAKSLIDAKFKSFSMTPVLGYLKTSRAKTIVLIIDACRSNPVAQTHFLKAGLATPLDAGTNTYIAYSTSPNNVAGDNPNGRNSWFTEALAATIPVPGLTIDDVFTRVRDKVESATAGKQTPWSYSSLKSRFYFHPPRNAGTENNESLISKWLEDALRNEQYGNWTEAIDLAERIVKQKPGGMVEETAKGRLPYLKARDAAQTGMEKGDYAAAVTQFDQALKLEPFDVGAAFEGASGAMLADDLPRAVRLLQVVRQRGTTPEVQRAEAILKELSVSEQAASAVLKGGAVKPPAVQEVFHTHRFGVPDWETGWRLVRQAPAPADYASIAKKLPPPPVSAAPTTPSPAPAASPQQQPQAQPVESAQAAASETPQQVITLDDLYVDVKATAGTRDLVTEEFAQITIRATSKKEIGLMLEGRPVSRRLPYTMKLPPGRYDIRTIEAGKARSERRLEVKPGINPDLVLQ